MKKKFLAAAALLALPAVAFAADQYVYDVELLTEGVEGALELVNLIVAVFAAALAVKLAALSQGGSLEKTWNLLAIAAVLFAVLEVVGALKGFGLVHIGGAGDIIEFAFLIVLTTAFYKTRKNLLKQVMGK